MLPRPTPTRSIAWMGAGLLAMLAPLAAAPPAAPARPAPAGRALVRTTLWPANGDPLEARTLSAKANGQPAGIVRALGPDDDLLLMLVLDVAGDLALVDPARNALVDAIPGLSQKTAIAVLRSQEGLRVVQDPTIDRTPVAEAIKSVAVTGRAGLLDTIEAAARLADSIRARAAVRVAVLYVTDSVVQNYRDDYTNPVINSSDSRDLSRRFPEGLIREKVSQLEARLLNTHSPVFIVHLAFQRDRLNEAYQAGLLQLAAATGGEAEIARTAADIGPLIAKSIERIGRHWSVELRLPERVQRTIQLELVANPQQQLSYRSRFMAQPSASGSGRRPAGPSSPGQPRRGGAGRSTAMSESGSPSVSPPQSGVRNP